MFDRLHHAVGLKKLVEDVLQDVLGITCIGDVATDEAAQPRLVALDGLGKKLILLGNCPTVRGHLVHLLKKTDEPLRILYLGEDFLLGWYTFAELFILVLKDGAVIS